MTSVAGACPACGAVLVSERDAAPWCERCAWGIDRYEPPPDTGWWRRRTGALAHRVAYGLTMKQFRSLAGSGSPFGAVAATPVGTLKPPRRWGFARIAAIVISLLLYGFMAYLVYLGVWLIRFRFPNPSIVPGAVLIAIAFVLLPRFPRLDKHTELLSRERAPTLFGLVDRLAQAVGTTPPRTIAVNSWCNASTTAIGLRRRRHLSLGVGLFGALDPQQRVALLAHEMGHFRNGDIRRGLVTQPAMTTLGRLSYLFGGKTLVSMRGWSGNGIAAIIEPLVDLVMAAISSVFWAAHLGVLAVMLRDSQRREYLADQRAAQLAGTRATAQLFDLLGSDLDSVVAARARAQQQQPAWREAAAQLLAPDRAAKMRRLRQLSTRWEVSLWNTHPPTGLRAWLLEAEMPQLPSLVLTEDESSRIDAELSGYYQRARRDLAQSGV